jgi:hypothetical protein
MSKRNFDFSKLDGENRIRISKYEFVETQMSNIEEIRRISQDAANRQAIEDAKREALKKKKDRECAKPYLTEVYAKIESEAKRGHSCYFFYADDVHRMEQKTQKRLENGCSVFDAVLGTADLLRDAGYQTKVSYNLINIPFVKIRWE